MSFSVKPLQTDLTIVTGRQLKSLLNSPSSSNQPKTCLSLPGTHRHTPVSSPTTACWSWLFKDIGGILSWPHDSVGNCRASLPLQSRTRQITYWALAEAHAAVRQTPVDARITTVRVCCWRTTWAHAEFPWPCYGQRGRPGQQHQAFPAEQSFYFLSSFFSVTWSNSNSTPGKESNHILKMTQELIILLMRKSGISLVVGFHRCLSKVEYPGFLCNT